MDASDGLGGCVYTLSAEQANILWPVLFDRRGQDPEGLVNLRTHGETMVTQWVVN